VAEGRHVIEVLDSAYRSSATGRPVEVGSAPVAPVPAAAPVPPPAAAAGEQAA
jgi:hypothetical protein